MTLLSEEILNKVWKEWNDKSGYLAISSYSRVSRRGVDQQKFENWLFEEGAMVTRINKRCYLHFSDAEDAVIFRLRYS